MKVAPPAPVRNNEPKKTIWWEKFRKSGAVAGEWGYYTPHDVQEIDCVDKLVNLFELYNHPSPYKIRNSHERAYVRVMACCLWWRLNKLGVL